MKLWLAAMSWTRFYEIYLPDGRGVYFRNEVF